MSGCLIAAMLSLALAVQSGTVSIKTLLREIQSEETLTRTPDPWYTVRQFSSYDRHSISKEEPGWFANGDSNNFLREETIDGRREKVLFDVEGPGAVVRWWMTFGSEGAGQGTLRVYIDGSPEPVLCAMAFDLLAGGKIASGCLGMSVSGDSRREQRGYNLYYPIPYASACKITYEPSPDAVNPVVYYNIDYRTYSPGTKVISYSEKQRAKNVRLAADVQRRLSEGPAPVKGKTVSLDAVLAPGQSKSVTVQARGAVRCLSLNISAPDTHQALRSLILIIAFDSQQTVWVPVGEFFRTGYKPLDVNLYNTRCSRSGQMTACWVMPFDRSVTLTLENLGSQQIEVSDGTLVWSRYAFDSSSMYFGADWHQYTRLDPRVPDTHYDINFTTLAGTGLYVGSGVTLFDTNAGWWGEGDEKVYVDGETFPGIFGTGTEDYFGYAWCRPELINDHPYISQPDGSGNIEVGYSVNTRLYGLDAISFRRSLVFDMELWHWNESLMNYAVTTFYYMIPGGRSSVPKDVAGAREKVAESPGDILH